MSKRTRLDPEVRKRQILTAAMKVARDEGLYSFSIANVSRSLEACSKETIKHYFSTVSGLRTAVIKEALEHGCHGDLVAQAITHGDPSIKHLSDFDKQGFLRNV